MCCCYSFIYVLPLTYFRQELPSSAPLKLPLGPPACGWFARPWDHCQPLEWLMFLSVLPWQGLIKIRGDRCWRDLTCMDFHYEVGCMAAADRAPCPPPPPPPRPWGPAPVL